MQLILSQLDNYRSNRAIVFSFSSNNARMGMNFMTDVDIEIYIPAVRRPAETYNSRKYIATSDNKPGIIISTVRY